MDSTPPSRRSEARLRLIKSVSRADYLGENLSPNLTPSPKKSPYHLTPSHNSNHALPLQELLILSPSPLHRSRHRTPDRIDNIEEPMDLVNSRRKCKSRTISSNLMGCSSPRITRRARRRSEQENREERDLGLGEENVRPRKRKQSRTAVARREKLSLVLSVPSTNSSSNSVRELISELIMWKDVAKSSLWFGFGSLCFSSSCFATGFSFSIVSTVSQLGLLFLGISFFYNSFSQRQKEEPREDSMLKEEDIVRATRVILPTANAAIKKTRELFSGEPSMTLKMAPILLFASEYGHLITLWRLAAAGFFIGFTVPKLCSYYSPQIQRQVECLRSRVGEAWAACSHKRIVAASAATAFWNLSTVKTRIFAAFIAIVIVRYYRQQPGVEVEMDEEGRGEEQQLALVVVTKEGDSNGEVHAGEKPNKQ
ncbi:reticulon-like protein B17 [Tasmannia lanceolata]|uniref:reticulon-like protein B17 n=1 Tax=Tasmannia lanceolata TaxID=3420 RepID=UPI0040642373